MFSIFSENRAILEITWKTMVQPDALQMTIYGGGGADKSLARSGRKEPRKHIKDSNDFNNIETRDVIKYLSLQGKAPKEIHAILTEKLACSLPGRAKDLSVPL